MVRNFDQRELRTALGTFATGVTIVTAVSRSGAYVGVTCNSFTSVSLEPPLVSWALSRRSQNMAAFLGARHFAVHVLAANQAELSAQFARSVADKFRDVRFTLGQGGVPLLSGVAACFECRNERQYEGGDHTIFLGEVIRFSEARHNPLIFHRGQYAVLQ